MQKTTAKKAGGVAGSIAVIVAAVFAMEGGWVNNSKDPGGETNHGVTKVVATQHGWEGSLKTMPKEFAEQVYYKDYIEKPGYLPIVELSPALAHKIVDAGVNAGTGRSSRWFQASLNAVNRDGKDYPDIAVDGSVGPGTVRAYESLVRVRGKFQACSMMVKLMDAHQAMHYVSLKNLETFTPGWVMNRIGNVPTSDCNH